MMATHTDFEHRRRERMRRERRRKKQIRAAVLLAVFLLLIILIIVGISRCALKKQSGTVGDAIETSTVTLGSGTTSVPTPAPSASLVNVPAASSENNLLSIIENSGEKKHCYLTFDDGPTTNITPQILDVLRRYNVKATFFQIGSLIKTNTSMARRVYEEGHLIANHSDGHNYAKLYVSTDTFMNEVNACYETIKDVTGEAEPFKLVRFPGGGFRSSDDSYSPVKQQCKEAMKDYGFYYCDWNTLNGDAEGKSKDADELLDYVIDSADGQDNIVILMHDAASKQATVDALPSIIEHFISKGYTFHRLDDITYKQSSSSADSSDEDDDDDTDNDDDYDTGSSSSSSSSSSSTASPAPTDTPAPTAASSSGSSSGSGGPIIIN